ncbi:MAG TPA: DUF2085 domain-containing protein [Pyrinomonadaceae bacterium]|nr:DUF2085 domain-containing protein [Pyrinomonadaceae bacterium]
MPASIAEYVPQFLSESEARAGRLRALAAWAALLTAVTLFLCLIAAAPWARAEGHETLAGVLYMSFGTVCHQMPERSFYLFGFPLAVCARCLGLYVGAAAGVLLYPAVRRLERSDVPARGWLLVAAVPTSFDFALGLFGIWANTHLSRFLTASLLGAVAAFYIVPAVLDFGRRRRRRKHQQREALA